MANVNSVVLVGNLTRDPELNHTASGYAVCNLRLAVNDRRKDSATGEWTDRPYYFNITVWGNQGEACATHLSKGSQCGVQGKLTWREWEAQDGTKRQAVDVEAFTVQFLGGKRDSNGGGGNGGGGNDFVPSGQSGAAGQSASSGDTDFGGSDDDIPF